MFRVKEEKLEHLNAAQHKNLFKKGVVGRIYAHLLSIENFGRVLSRRARQAPLPQPAPAAPAKAEPVKATAKAGRK
jgi:hypothetical protein